MKKLPHLFDKNRRWAEGISESDPQFFPKLSAQQAPEYLWIGCSDSRVPANEIVGLLPGEMFVHRNIANMVVQTDMNCLSVMQFAVDHLRVKHIIVCGHYGCGGVAAAIDDKPHGLVDNWLRNIRNIYQRHKNELGAIGDRDQMLRRLCEWNVIEQAMNVASTTIVQDAWTRGQELSVHGWIYGLKDGLLKDLDVLITDNDTLREMKDRCIAST